MRKPRKIRNALLLLILAVLLAESALLAVRAASRGFFKTAYFYTPDYRLTVTKKVRWDWRGYIGFSSGDRKLYVLLDPSFGEAYRWVGRGLHSHAWSDV